MVSLTIETLRESLSQATPPPGLTLAQQAVWWAGKGDWAAAHARVQQAEGTPDCDWVHAYLHRQEGDLSNARYWYRSAGQPMAQDSLEAEWARIAAALLG